MSRPRPNLQRSPIRSTRRRALRPGPEALEDRILLYSSLGDKWTYSSRITYSFMPDRTSVGGVPSALFQTLNRAATTAAWEQQIEQAATLWESNSNINLALVSDGGQAVGTSGNQQDDSRFGDIRIGAIPMASGVLAITFAPPPANGGTDAGDILLNSNVNWQINSNYDLMTVMAHEFGHALGLGDQSTDSAAVMYGNYTGIKQTVDSDDITGIQSIYGTRQYDAYNTGGPRNNSFFTPTNLNSKIVNAQISIPGLDITTIGDSEWYYVNVPSTTTGKMTVTVQSSNLSSLSPSVQIYNSSLSLVGQASAANSMGATISVPNINVASGQGFYVKVLAASGYGAIGGYGLLVNFGSQTQSPIPPPNTVVAQQPDRGGGSITNAIAIGPINPDGSPGNPGSPLVSTTIGMLTGWTDSFAVQTQAVPTAPSTPAGNYVPQSPSPTPTPIALISTVSAVSAVPIPAEKHTLGPASVPKKLKLAHAAGHKWTVKPRLRHVIHHAISKHHRSH